MEVMSYRDLTRVITRRPGSPIGWGHLLQAVLALWIGHISGIASADTMNFSVTSAPIRLRPGETAFAIPVPQFDPSAHASAPILEQVSLTVSVVLTANIGLADVVESNTPISYLLGPAILRITPALSNLVIPAPLSLNLAGTNLPNSPYTFPLVATSGTSETIASTGSTALSAFTGTNTWVSDLDFLASYPPHVGTDRSTATALFGDDAMVVTLVAQYTSSPEITVIGPTQFVYSGIPQFPTNYLLLGTQRAVSFSYQGSSGTVYGPTTHPPTAVGTYTVTASVNADANDVAASSSPLTFGILPAQLAITPQPIVKIYGGTITLGHGQAGFSAVGLVNGEKIGSVTLSATGGTGAADSVGNYILTANSATGGTFVASNYQISYVPSTFSVTPAPSSIVITGATNYLFTGGPLGPSTAVVTGSTGRISFLYSSLGNQGYPSNPTPPTSLGSYTVTASVAADSNHQAATSAPFSFYITSSATDSSSDVPLLPPWGFLAIAFGFLGMGRRSFNR